MAQILDQAGNPILDQSGANLLDMQAGGISGSLSQTLDALALSATGVLPIQATLSATLGAVTVSATATLPITAAATVTLDPVTLSSTGAAGAAPIAGTLSATLGPLIVSSTGTLRIAGQVSATLGALSLSATGQLGAAGRTGALAATLGPLTAVATGELGPPPFPTTVRPLHIRVRPGFTVRSSDVDATSRPAFHHRMVDERGVATRETAALLERIWNRTSRPEGNLVDEARSEAGTARVSASQLSTNLDQHERLTEAHGANGDILGALDVPTAARRGPVLRAAAVSDAAASAVVVSAAAAPSPSATYQRAEADAAVVLVNELRGDVAALSAEVTALSIALNALLSSLRASGALAP